MRAAFVVSSAGIRQHPLSTYITLARITENSSMVNINKGCFTKMSFADYSAHAFERLWTTIFETSEHNRQV
tara:strand:- start:1977 stop:2189 length:213 start_codon:yes stop_codon:yes gene_type:complete